jgi:hypothetical protein
VDGLRPGPPRVGHRQGVNVGNVAEFSFNKKGTRLAVVIDAQGQAGNGIQLRDMASGAVVSLDNDKASYKSLSWTEKGEAFAALKGKEDKAYEDKLWSVVAYSGFEGAKGPQKIVYDPAGDKSFPEGMTVSPNRAPEWTESFDAILFGIQEDKKKPDAGKKEEGEAKAGKEAAPTPPQKAEDIADEDIPDLDGGHFLYYDDGHFYTYDMAMGRSVNITRDVAASFVDEDDDHNVVKPPDYPVGSANQPIFESSQGRFKGGYWDNLEAYQRNSPVYYAERVKTPLIILHNDKDGAVNWNQGIEYYNTLRRLKKPVIMLQYVGENHGLRKPANQKDYTVRMKEFFDYFLMGKPAPAWYTEGVSHLKLKDYLKERAKDLKLAEKTEKTEKAEKTEKKAPDKK